MAKSFKGHFLISAKHLKDQNFYKSVVLLIEHGADGAMGVIINRPLDVSLFSVLSQHFPIPETELALYSGGPVEENALLILHNSEAHDQELGEIAPGVFVGTSPDVFDRVIRALEGSDDEFQFKVFAGYSGWSAGQLEHELRRGDWYTLRATTEPVFRDDPYSIWDDELRRFHAQHAIIPTETTNDEAQWN